jgi:predicted Zn-dependent protease
MMINAYAEASARDASEGRSVYSGPSGPRIGDALTPLPAHLYSDPSYAGIECAPFQVVAQPWGSLTSVFDNGVPLEPVDWISDGRLANLIGTRAWSESSGVKAAQFVDNLILDAGGTVSLDEMVAATERGLLLTTLWYMRTVDPQTLLLTGLTRDGVYLVENGTVSGAVNNFRFNESPIDLLARATEAGQATRTLPREMSDYFRRTAMPALRVPDFNMSTVSAAS